MDSTGCFVTFRSMSCCILGIVNVSKSSTNDEFDVSLDVYDVLAFSWRLAEGFLVVCSNNNVFDFVLLGELVVRHRK